MTYNMYICDINVFKHQHVTSPSTFPDITISDASFKGEASYLGLVPPRNIRYSVALELQLKPTVESGLVLYMAEHLSVRTSDFLSLELYRGWIQLRYNTGSDQPTVIRSRQQLDINTGGGFMLFISWSLAGWDQASWWFVLVCPFNLGHHSL